MHAVGGIGVWVPRGEEGDQQGADERIEECAIEFCMSESTEQGHGYWSKIRGPWPSSTRMEAFALYLGLF
eukprot:8209126-Alexandrium_andersonii.AAC.1